MELDLLVRFKKCAFWMLFNLSIVFALILLLRLSKLWPMEDKGRWKV